jgi:hypothetical protein
MIIKSDYQLTKGQIIKNYWNKFRKKFLTLRHENDQNDKGYSWIVEENFTIFN